MSRFINLAGQRFGRLVVTGRSGRGKHAVTLWLCRCDCGNDKTANTARLRSGKILSCGCLHSETSRASIAANRKPRYTHRGTGTPEHTTWNSMRDRCSRPKNKDYPAYGGRGIRVCERWLGPSGFSNFLADMGPRPDGMSIDRRNVNGHYEPGNCRWATDIEQRHNRRDIKAA